MNTQLNLAVVGCGSFSTYAHGPAQKKFAQANPHARLVACCDTEIDRAKAYADKYGFSHAYSDMDEMLLREQPDAILLTVPPAVTPKLATGLIKRGIPLFIEKPPAMSAVELDGLIQLAQETGTPTQVAFNRRYMPMIRKIKKILDGQFPSLMQVDYTMVRYNRTDADFSATAIHAIDAALYLAGSPYRKASLSFHDMTNFGDSCVNTDIYAECESGTSVRLNFQPLAGKVYDQITIHGPGKTLTANLEISEAQNQEQVFYYEGDILKRSIAESESDFVVKSGIYGELAAFCQSLQNGTPPSPSLQECRQQVILMEAIRSRKTYVKFPQALPSEPLAPPEQVAG